MAAALFEALEAGPEGWRDLDIRVLPGITAMLAAAARAGAPLGHDFCAINLSDNLKPWPSRSEEHTSELQSLMRISYAVFCLKKKKTIHKQLHTTIHNT